MDVMILIIFYLVIGMTLTVLLSDEMDPFDGLDVIVAWPWEVIKIFGVILFLVGALVVFLLLDAYAIIKGIFK